MIILYQWSPSEKRFSETTKGKSNWNSLFALTVQLDGLLDSPHLTRRTTITNDAVAA